MQVGAVSPITMQHWGRYASWCREIPKCRPMPLEVFNRYTVPDDGNVEYSTFMSTAARASEDEEEEEIVDLAEAL
jgi:hypothetical protein